MSRRMLGEGVFSVKLGVSKIGLIESAFYGINSCKRRLRGHDPEDQCAFLRNGSQREAPTESGYPEWNRIPGMNALCNSVSSR